MKTAQLFDELSRLGNNIEINSPNNLLDQKIIPRLGGMEILASFIASAAAIQLAKALRDFAKKQSIALKLVNSDKQELVLTASGHDLKSVSDIVGFLMKQHTKQSQFGSDTNNRENIAEIENSTSKDGENDDLDV